MPFHATVEKDPEPEVLEVAEAMGDAQDLLDDEIDRLRGAIRCAGEVVGQDLDPPTQGGAGQTVELGDVRRLALSDEGVESASCLGDVVGRIGPAQRLLGQHGVEHLVERVPGGEADLEAGTASLVEALGAAQQQAADAVEGIAGATAVAEGVLLDPATNSSMARLARATAWKGSTTRVAWASFSATPLA